MARYQLCDSARITLRCGKSATLARQVMSGTVLEAM
jgi:hypothetical protein